VSYEGYAPGGVAVFVETLTDNRNRTGAEVRSLFNRLGGSLAEPGAVAWQFERKGVVVVDRAADEEELMMAALDAGADDIADEGEAWRVTTAPGDVHAVRAAIEAAGMTVESSDSVMVPQNTVPLETPEAAKQVLRLIDALDDQDDVGEVTANFDIPDAILEKVEA
jgi:YebC/PmpR family DNA-binding regulatory protein